MVRPAVSEIRNASRDDAGVIFSFLASLSAEIPVKMDTEGERGCTFTSVATNKPRG
jgi:hypothetical protein